MSWTAQGKGTVLHRSRQDTLDVLHDKESRASLADHPEETSEHRPSGVRQGATLPRCAEGLATRSSRYEDWISWLESGGREYLLGGHVFELACNQGEFR